MNSLEAQMARRLAEYICVPVSVRMSFDGHGRKVTARPSVLPNGHGFLFEARQVYSGAMEADLVLESYGHDLIRAWRDSRHTTVEMAFGYLESLPFDCRVYLSVRGSKASDAQQVANIPDEDWIAADTRMRLVVRESGTRDVWIDSLRAALGFSLLLADLFPNEEDDPGSEVALEGAKVERRETAYERSWPNRMRCIAIHGTRCAVCGFDFGEAYGELFGGMIEVHHIKPVSSYEKATLVDPAHDLIPLCANCHRAIHRINPPMMPDELKNLYANGGK